MELRRFFGSGSNRGAGVRPDFNRNRKQVSVMGYRLDSQFDWTAIIFRARCRELRCA
jgi:hypothetical protein